MEWSEAERNGTKAVKGWVRSEATRAGAEAPPCTPAGIGGAGERVLRVFE